MSRVQLPRQVEKEVKAIVFRLADEQQYLGMSRDESSQFMENLVKSETVGAVLGQHLEKARIRLYIKDAILNRYSKQAAEKAVPDDIPALIEARFKFKVSLSHEKNQVRLYRSLDLDGQARFVVVAQGTYLKWETALRKALLYRAANPFSANGSAVHLMLILACQGKKIAPSDKKLLETALLPFGAVAMVV